MNGDRIAAGMASILDEALEDEARRLEADADADGDAEAIGRKITGHGLAKLTDR